MSLKQFARVLALGRALPGVEESTSYGTPALKVRSRFLARMREDGQTLVLKCADMDEKEFLLHSAPEIFFETDHYKGWTSLLVNLEHISDAHLFELLEQSWRREAGTRLVADYDQTPTAPVVSRAGKATKGAKKRPRNRASSTQSDPIK